MIVRAVGGASHGRVNGRDPWKERPFSIESGKSPGYDDGLTLDKWGTSGEREIPGLSGGSDPGLAGMANVGRGTLSRLMTSFQAVYGGETMKVHRTAIRLNQRIVRDLVAVTASLLVLVFGTLVQAQARSPAAAGAVAAEAPALGDLRPPATPKPALQPPSLVYGVDVQPIVRVGLGPVDVAALLEEDAARARLDKVLRYGVGRDILVQLADGRQCNGVRGRMPGVPDVIGLCESLRFQHLQC